MRAKQLTFADKVWYMCEGACTTLYVFTAATALSLIFLMIV